MKITAAAEEDFEATVPAIIPRMLCIVTISITWSTTSKLLLLTNRHESIGLRPTATITSC